MSQFYVPGPAYISVGVGAAGALEFLGFTLDGLLIAVQPRWDDIFSDLSGPAIPQDVQFLGADAVVRFSLSRFNAGTLNKIRGLCLGYTEGQGPACSIGSLLRAESLAMRLFIRAGYGPGGNCAKAAYNTGPQAQRGVYNFPLAYPAEALEIPISTRPAQPRITFRGWPLITSVTGSWVLYNDTATGEPTYS